MQAALGEFATRIVHGIFAAVAIGALLTANATSPVWALSPLKGHWAGEMVSRSASLPVEFDFDMTHENLHGSFTSLTQRAMEYPLDSVEQHESQVRFVLAGPTTFEGTLTGDRMTGRFMGSNASGTFSLQKTAAPSFPYDLKDVSFHNGDAVLSGTLLLPRGRDKHPAVVLLQGSGPETRWGTNRFIADHFARAGVAALIYDKRGSGKSTGDWKTSDYEDLAKDVLSGVALLASRSDIDAKKIGLHGHSEGGIIAPLAAARAPSSLAFVVAEDTVAGFIKDQDIYRVSHALAREFSPADTASAMKLYEMFLQVALGDRPYSDLAGASMPVKNQPWYQWLSLPGQDSWLWTWYPKVGSLNTLAYWSQVKAPVLLVYGQNDELVPVDDSIAKIEASLDKNNVPYTALIAPLAQHNLTIHPDTGQPFFWWKGAPGIVDITVAWVKLQTSHLQ